MKKIDVLNQTGSKVEEVELNKNVFGVKPNDSVVYDAIQVYMSNSRQATAKTKKRDGAGQKISQKKFVCFIVNLDTSFYSKLCHTYL